MPHKKLGTRLLIGLACYLMAAAAVAGPPTLVVEGASVFDSEAGVMLPDRTIVVEGQRIQSIIPSGEQPQLPKDATVIDARGLFIVPGLIDAHVHLVHLAEKSHVAGDQILPLFLAAGVTSVRDTGDAIVAESIVARYADSHPDYCPRVFLASPLIDGDPPFHRDVGYALTDPALVRPFVEDMLAWNVSTLKIYVGTTRPIGREVIQEAHRHGLKVTAHLGLYSAQDAVMDGIDCLEHIWSVFNYCIPAEAASRPDHRSTLDLNNPQAQGLVQMIAENKVSVDPTLVVFRNMIYLNDLEEVHKHPDLARVPKRILDYWHSYRQSSNLLPGTLELRRKEIAKYQELTGILHRKGVTILAGTDSPEPFVPPGSSLHQELEMLVESGLSPSAALQAATINNARALGQQDNLGSIAPGKWADMVILDADPTQDIRHTRGVRHVIRGGIVCNPEEVVARVPAE